MTVVVFTRNQCGACVGTKAALERQGTEFTEVNVQDEGSEHYQQQLVDQGYRAMPVVKVYDDGEVVNHWSGMQLEKIRALAA